MAPWKEPWNYEAYAIPWWVVSSEMEASEEPTMIDANIPSLDLFF